MAATNHSCSENKINKFPAELQAYLCNVFPMLSAKECETLYWFSKGYARDHIADLMSVKPRTVSFHLDSCKDKFDCSSTALLRSIYHCWLETARIVNNSTAA
ncbi:MAG: helix-turn-helix transcriptional regulator [Lactococcus garvieae]